MDKKEILRMFAYGGELREAIEKIVKARGALVVFVKTKAVFHACVGGFKLDETFTGEKLAELAKLDGAILVDASLKKILYANVLLNPNPKIPSSETGTRHQAAERIAKQFNTLVLAISERTKIATIYYGASKIKLSNLGELFTKAGETLKSLEKNERTFEKLIKKLDVAELLELVRIDDLILIFQRKKIIDLISDRSLVYLAELGQEGEIVEVQFAEITNFVNEEISLIKKDYEDYFDFGSIEESLSKMRYDEILNKKNILNVFSKKMKKRGEIIPKGYRILRNVTILSDEDINLIISNFQNLRALINASEEDFVSKGIEKKKAKAIKEYLLRAQL